MARIDIKNMSLNYLVYHSLGRSLKSTILQSSVGGIIQRKGASATQITALQDIDISLETGSRLALLGHNGAGKTSLLRCMAGIYSPDAGELSTDGKTEVLIDPYSGLNHEATGRQNIYSLGYARGYLKDYISQFEQEIIDFSELGAFIDLPIRTFSAGMVSRLSFSLITHLKPEIMLIDEAIGAGDFEFQKKAADKFKTYLKNIDILVLSTHSIELARLYCKNYVRLEKGRIVEEGLLQ